jgi:DnaD/phage-associated family protein
MANTTLHWEFRKVLPMFREGARLPVYMCYLLHANERGRSWPSIDLIEKETGYYRAAVVAAKKWLLESGAIERVPYDKRMDDEEKKLPRRLHVVQITGKLKVSEKEYALLYFNSSQNELLEGADSSPIKSSKIKRSRIEPKVVTSKDSEVITKPAEVAAAAERPNVFTVYEHEIGALTPLVRDELLDIEKTYPEGWFEDAVKEAVTSNARNLKYIEAILRRWKVEGRGPRKGSTGKPASDPDDWSDLSEYVLEKRKQLLRSKESPERVSTPVGQEKSNVKAA